MAAGRKTGGRQRGTPNKRTSARKTAEQLVGDSYTPLEYLIEVMRNTGINTDLRLEAAKAAAPYVHPRLASVTVKGDEDAPVQVVSRIELVPVEPKPANT